jgi:hypothetical protein
VWDAARRGCSYALIRVLGQSCELTLHNCRL